MLKNEVNSTAFFTDKGRVWPGLSKYFFLYSKPGKLIPQNVIIPTRNNNNQAFQDVTQKCSGMEHMTQKANFIALSWCRLVPKTQKLMHVLGKMLHIWAHSDP